MPDDKQNGGESTEVESTDGSSVNEDEEIEIGTEEDTQASEASATENDEEVEDTLGDEDAEETAETEKEFEFEEEAETEEESEAEEEAEESPEYGEGGETAEPPEKAADEVYCSSCGAAIKRDAEVCPECGVRQQGGSEEKNPGIAAVASFFIPGLGDLYNGEFARGGIVFLVWIVGAFVWGLLVTVLGVFTLGLGLLLLPLYAVANVVSAYLSYKQAEKINAGEITV